jgi:hypothetical protein
LKCAPKKFENPAKLFDPSEMPSVMVQTGHVSDMRGPSVMPSVCDVGNAVGNRADGHVSDMRADNSIGDAVGIGVGNSVGECGKIP